MMKLKERPTYSGFVTMISDGCEVLYEFKDGYFSQDGLRARYRLSGGDFTFGYGYFAFQGYSPKWFISELRFVF